jgi:hypothetical protein
VRTSPTFGNSLQFALEDLDLSYVPSMIAQVDEILEASRCRVYTDGARNTGTNGCSTPDLPQPELCP